MDLEQKAGRARDASLRLATITGEAKNVALRAMARALDENAERVVEANRADLRRAAADELAPPLLKRLRLDEAGLAEAVRGISSLVALDDPVGRTLSATELDGGLELYRVTCPIGVIGVVFESRPDALVQISALALKSGNAVLLKGGREAMETNRVLAETISEATAAAGMPEGWMVLLESREDVAAMLAMDDLIDLVIPRGGKEFVRRVMDGTRIPVLGHADGICHVYIDRAADLEMAIAVTVDSKCQYPAVCNAAETLLIHRAVAADILPGLAAALIERGVELRGCDRTARIIEVAPADAADWGTEYLDLVLSIKVVDGLEEAIGHINRYGSGHTDVIVSADSARAARFLDLVDSACVFVNCSSRFSDGFRFGLGAEVGVATGKIHARGPVGLEGLVSSKWRLLGNGHVVADYTGGHARAFTHRRLAKSYGS